MKIRDKNGNWIEVTDLKKAIQQTGWYKEYTARTGYVDHLIPI